MMKLLQSFVIAFSMYSKIPMPKVDWNKENMKYAMCFFPAVGLLIGAVVYGAGTMLFSLSCGTFFRSAVFTLLPILITGGIHLDGFMDTVDALASYGDREKKLNILKDSHAGAFAILGLGCYLVWSLAIWSEAEVHMLPVLACVFVLSRSLSGFSIVTFPAARENGLARTFQAGAEKLRVRIAMIVYLLLAVFYVLWMNWQQALGMLIGAAIVFFYYCSMSKKQFGGITGDLAGYFLQLAELAMVTGIVIAGSGV